MKQRDEIAAAARAALDAGPRVMQWIEADSELPIAQLVRLDRPRLEYILAEPVGRDGWAFTAVDVDGTRMNYTSDGQPEFGVTAERWRRPTQILCALVMTVYLWWLASASGLQDQAVQAVGNFSLIANAPTDSYRTIAYGAVLLPIAVLWTAFGCLMGRFLADTLLRSLSGAKR